LLVRKELGKGILGIWGHKSPEGIKEILGKVKGKRKIM
jgi:hypothetical protein